MAGRGGHSWLINLLVGFFILAVNAEAVFVNITFIDSAVPNGAVCLDGSPPAYYFAPGSGNGANNWLIYLEGGAWCETGSECMERAKNSPLGSSYKKDKRNYLGGMLSEKPHVNPAFYNWNRVFVGYCDGSSFMSDVEVVDPYNNLTLRGQRIFNAVMEELRSKGMTNAENVLLSGGSAGGLATILHCDSLRALVPQATRVKCLSDSGFFITAKHLPGAIQRVERMERVVNFHKLSNALPASCTSRMNPHWCMFPENIVGEIDTPLFVIESMFDSWKMRYDVVPPPPAIDQRVTWEQCLNNTRSCTLLQLQAMRHYGATLIYTMHKSQSPTIGMFLHSCYFHGMMHTDTAWGTRPVLKGKAASRAVGDWYFDRTSFQEIDVTNKYPVDTCLRK